MKSLIAAPLKSHDTSHLHLLANGIFVDATDGDRTFANMRDMFKGYFDGRLSQLSAPRISTERSASRLYQITKSGNFREIVSSLRGDPLSYFWQSEEQVISWITDHQMRLDLNQGLWGAYFPLLDGRKKIIFRTGMNTNRNLEAYYYDFEDENMLRSSAFDTRLIVAEPN